MIFNLVNSHTYVGQTHGTVRSRWQRHWSDAKRHGSYPLYRAFQKYGRESFEVVELAEVNNQNDLDNIEKSWIILLRSEYNVREGGSRGKNSLETRAKISASRMGRPSWNKGKPFSVETREKMRLAALGNTKCAGRKLSEETKAKIGLASLGRTHKLTFESRMKISASKIGKKKVNGRMI